MVRNLSKPSLLRISILIAIINAIAAFTSGYCQSAKPPILGWSSWNNFRIHIDENLIREQADAMVSSGLYDAGYRFINIDDGYFEGRDSYGKLKVNHQKFPSGMKTLTNYIHSKGLKAGIYTDAGKNTCGSVWDNDSNGIGAGLYDHEESDLYRMLNDWNFDFIKVDWCGGKLMHLDSATEYQKIIDIVRAIKPETVFNICCWKFPGEWAILKADSWRISGDIRPEFSSILHIIDLNADLYKYASPGHYNDMDMLQVGRGMTYEEDKSHFSMWCMLNSPLLAGNDLRNMSAQTKEILTNSEVIALNQDMAFRQAKRIFRQGNTEIWVKPLAGKPEESFAIAILNRGPKAKYTLTPASAGLSTKYQLRDLWAHKDLGILEKAKTFHLPEHGIIVLRATSVK